MEESKSWLINMKSGYWFLRQRNGDASWHYTTYLLHFTVQQHGALIAERRGAIVSAAPLLGWDFYLPNGK